MYVEKHWKRSINNIKTQRCYSKYFLGIRGGKTFSDKVPKYKLKSLKCSKFNILKLFFTQRNFKQRKNLGYKAERSFNMII